MHIFLKFVSKYCIYFKDKEISSIIFIIKIIEFQDKSGLLIHNESQS